MQEYTDGLRESIEYALYHHPLDTLPLRYRWWWGIADCFWRVIGSEVFYDTLGALFFLFVLFGLPIIFANYMTHLQ